MAGVTSIGNSSGEGVITLGHDTWNIGDGFTKIKILRLLIECDLLETIARFGAKDLEEAQMMTEQQLAFARVEAVKRLMFALRQLIGNCAFAIHERHDKNFISGLYQRLDNVERNANAVANQSYNDLTKETIIVINEEHFEISMRILRNIKDDINDPLNRAGLIFRKSDELNLDQIVNEIVEGG